MNTQPKALDNDSCDRAIRVRLPSGIYFVMRHGGNASKALPVVGVILLLAMVVYLAPAAPEGDQSTEITDTQIQQVMNDRCVACHASKPTQAGFVSPPLGLVLETSAQTKQNAVKIATTVQTKYMPLGNLTQMTDEERG